MAAEESSVSGQGEVGPRNGMAHSEAALVLSFSKIVMAVSQGAIFFLYEETSVILTVLMVNMDKEMGRKM